MNSMNIKTVFLLFGLMISQNLFAAQPNLILGQLPDAAPYLPGEVWFSYGKTFDEVFELLKNYQRKDNDIKWKITFKRFEAELEAAGKLSQADPIRNHAYVFMQTLLDNARFDDQLIDLEAERGRMPYEELNKMVHRLEIIKDQIPVISKLEEQAFIAYMYIPGQIAGVQNNNYAELFDELVAAFNTAQGEKLIKVQALHRQLAKLGTDAIDADEKLHEQSVLAMRLLFDDIEIKRQKESIEKLKNADVFYEAPASREERLAKAAKMEAHLELLQQKVNNNFEQVQQVLEEKKVEIENKIVQPDFVVDKPMVDESKIVEPQPKPQFVPEPKKAEPPVVLARNKKAKDNKKKADEVLPQEEGSSYKRAQQAGCGVGCLSLVYFYRDYKNKESAMLTRKLIESDLSDEQKKLELEKAIAPLSKYKPQTIKDAFCLGGAAVCAGLGVAITLR